MRNNDSNIFMFLFLIVFVFSFYLFFEGALEFSDSVTGYFLFDGNVPYDFDIISFFIIALISALIFGLLTKEVAIIYKKIQFTRLPKECSLRNSPFFQRQVMTRIFNLMIEVKRYASTDWSKSYALYQELGKYYNLLILENKKKMYPYLDNLMYYMQHVLTDDEDYKP